MLVFSIVTSLAGHNTISVVIIVRIKTHVQPDCLVWRRRPGGFHTWMLVSCNNHPPPILPTMTRWRFERSPMLSEYKHWRVISWNCLGIEPWLLIAMIYRKTFISNDQLIKSNLHYTRGITPKRATSGGIHLRGLAPGQHSSEETSQRWRAVGNAVYDLIGTESNPDLPGRDLATGRHHFILEM